MYNSKIDHLYTPEIKAMQADQLIAEIANTPEENWESIFPMRERLSQLLMPTQSVEFNKAEWSVMPIADPAELKVGELVKYRDFVGKIAVIESFPAAHGEDPSYPCYVVKVEYVCGDLDMFHYFRAHINNGVSRSHLAKIQGTRRAMYWNRVTKKA